MVSEGEVAEQVERVSKVGRWVMREVIEDRVSVQEGMRVEAGWRKFFRNLRIIL